MKLSMNFLFFVIYMYNNNYSIVVYGGSVIRFPLFKALNNNLEARLFYMFIFMPHQIF